MPGFLRRKILHNWVLKLLSLALAVLLFVIVRSEKQALVQGTVGISYAIPPGKVLSQSAPAALLIGVTGPASRMQRFRFEDLPPVIVDLEGEPEGYFKFRESLLSLPTNIKLSYMRPEGFIVRYEPTIRRRLEVVVEVRGEVAPGFLMRSRWARPSRVLLRGPRSLIQALEDVPTQPLEIQGATRNVVRKVPLATLPPGIEAEGPEVVEATVEVVLDTRR